MREQKYRAWDKQDKRMIVHEQEFIPIKVTSAGVLRLNPHHEEDFYEFMETDRFELMQYINLNDKNGVEIYEGDIIKYPDYWSKEYRVGVLTFVATSYWFLSGERRVSIHSFFTGNHPNVPAGTERDIEVIGNIHQNPELVTS